MPAEKYEGVKFKTIALGAEAPAEVPEKDSTTLIGWCRRFSDLMLVATEAGNLSFRFKTGFVITPTGKSKAELSPDDLVRVTGCDVEKREVAVARGGLFEPSSESMLHWLVYQNRKDVNAIFHLHDFDVLDKRDELKIKSTARPLPYGTLELAREVLSVLGKSEKYVIIKNHGTLAVGGTMDEAGELALDVHARALE